MAYCWPFSSHICHTREIGVNIFQTELLVYCSAIYPQWKTFKYGLGGRLMYTGFEVMGVSRIQELGFKYKTAFLEGEGLNATLELHFPNF